MEHSCTFQGVFWKELAFFDAFCLWRFFSIILSGSTVQLERWGISYQNKGDDFSFDRPKFCNILGTDFDKIQIIKICAIDKQTLAEQTAEKVQKSKN